MPPKEGLPEPLSETLHRFLHKTKPRNLFGFQLLSLSTLLWNYEPPKPGTATNKTRFLDPSVDSRFDSDFFDSYKLSVSKANLQHGECLDSLSLPLPKSNKLWWLSGDFPSPPLSPINQKPD